LGKLVPLIISDEVKAVWDKSTKTDTRVDINWQQIGKITRKYT